MYSNRSINSTTPETQETGGTIGAKLATENETRSDWQTEVSPHQISGGEKGILRKSPRIGRFRKQSNKGYL